MGTGDAISRNRPAQISTAATWWKIACGTKYSIAIKTDGTLWGWGDNSYFQLGLGDNIVRNTPTQINYESNWKEIACYERHAMAIKTDGTLWGWGNNAYGQLGLGDFVERISPTQIGTDANWSKISCGQLYTLAIKTDGTLWSWGDNSYGVLGLNDSISFYMISPTQVGSNAGWDMISSGQDFAVAIRTDGTLWSWGNNLFGQLGLGNQGAGTEKYTPVQVGVESDWSNVVCGSYKITLAIKKSGTIWSWGLIKSTVKVTIVD